jgi:hypothetical protein
MWLDSFARGGEEVATQILHMLKIMSQHASDTELHAIETLCHPINEYMSDVKYPIDISPDTAAAIIPSGEQNG